MILLTLLIALALIPLLILALRGRLGLPTAAYLGTLASAIGLTIGFYLTAPGNWNRTFTGVGLGFLATVVIFGLIEFVLLRLLEIFRLGALVRVTYYEALLHPFTLILLGLGLVVIGYLAYTIPYYTLSEDFKMYRDVSTQFTLVCALAIMVFASAKVIDEEIENRTMLTLMSKPIARWQVIIGKYLGVVLIVAAVILVLGITTAIGSYLRYFEDMRIDLDLAERSKDWTEFARLNWVNVKGSLLLAPLFTLQFFQVATLAAVAVAISTRYPLALNVTVIALLYVGANLTRFVVRPEFAQLPGLTGPWPMIWVLAACAVLGVLLFVPVRLRRRLGIALLIAAAAALVHGVMWVGHIDLHWRPLVTQAVHILPFLSNFDLDSPLIYGQVAIGREGLFSRGAPTWGGIWAYVGLAGAYAVLYISAALAVATALFRTRELT